MQGWANRKVAYLFFSNERVSEADILAGHFRSTSERLAATDGLVFMLHDTNLKQSMKLFGDPGRCVHIGDRESDIYELFCTARGIGMNFLIRTCVDRLAGAADHMIAMR